MKTVVIRKVQGVGSHPTPNLKIVLDEPVPDFESLDEAADFFEAQATELEGALSKVLPGGTPDRLTARLLQRKASLLVIPAIDES